MSLSGINKQIHFGAKWLWEDSTKAGGCEVADYIGVCTCLCLQILHKAHLVVFCPCLTPQQQLPNFITPSQIILFWEYFFLVCLFSLPKSPSAMYWNYYITKTTVIWDVTPCKLVDVYQGGCGVFLSQTSVHIYHITWCHIPDGRYLL